MAPPTFNLTFSLAKVALSKKKKVGRGCYIIIKSFLI